MIITVREDELLAVLERFSPHRPVSGGKQMYEYCDCTTAAGEGRRVVVVRSTEQGQTAAQSVARDVIEDLAPGWLVLVGIAGGIPDREFTLGDVLLASRLHDFSLEYDKRCDILRPNENAKFYLAIGDRLAEPIVSVLAEVSLTKICA